MELAAQTKGTVRIPIPDGVKVMTYHSILDNALEVTMLVEAEDQDAARRLLDEALGNIAVGLRLPQLEGSREILTATPSDLSESLE